MYLVSSYSYVLWEYMGVMSQVVGVVTMPIYTFAASSRGAQHGSDSWVILPLPWRCWVGKRWPQGCRKDQVSHFSTTIFGVGKICKPHVSGNLWVTPQQNTALLGFGVSILTDRVVFFGQGTVRLLDQNSNTSLGLCSVHKLHYLWIYLPQAI